MKTRLCPNIVSPKACPRPTCGPSMAHPWPTYCPLLAHPWPTCGLIVSSSLCILYRVSSLVKDFVKFLFAHCSLLAEFSYMDLSLFTLYRKDSFVENLVKFLFTHCLLLAQCSRRPWVGHGWAMGGQWVGNGRATGKQKLN